jgi:hypothetical protein
MDVYVRIRIPARRAAAAALSALLALPALAGTSIPNATVPDARVERLLWIVANDERFSHLRYAASADKLRQLLELGCVVATTPCLQTGERQAHTQTADLSPEQLHMLEKLLTTVHEAAAPAFIVDREFLLTVVE